MKSSPCWLQLEKALAQQRRPNTAKNKNKLIRVKMVVWEDTELASLHNWGTCQPLVGNSDRQGDGRNPRVNR